MAKLTFDEAAAYLKGRDGELNGPVTLVLSPASPWLEQSL